MSKKIEHNDRIEYRNDNNQLHRLDGPAIEGSDGRNGGMLTVGVTD